MTLTCLSSPYYAPIRPGEKPLLDHPMPGRSVQHVSKPCQIRECHNYIEVQPRHTRPIAMSGRRQDGPNRGLLP